MSNTNKLEGLYESSHFTFRKIKFIQQQQSNPESLVGPATKMNESRFSR